MNENVKRREMKGPSIFENTNNIDTTKLLNPDIIEKIKKNPKLIEMIKEKEENNNIEKLNPKERLKARLRQKKNSRCTAKVKDLKSKK